jgi:adenosylcobinamide-GDP ribazoletransferase
MSGFRTEFVLAVGFLTRLPVPAVDYSDAAMARATRLYPLVGLMLGGALASLLWGLTLIFPQPIAVLLTLAASARLTGALHEDGLADAGDGLGGGWTREQALEIMRDSRIGTYGAMSLVLTLAVRAAALAYLPLPAAMAALVAGHTLGRFAITRLIVLLDYARAKGAGDFLADVSVLKGPAPWPPAILATILIFLVAGPIAAGAAVLATVFVLWSMRRWLQRKLGGFTGDTLGASEQLVETAVPLVILACL